MFILPIPTHEEFRSWGARAIVVWSLVAINSAVFLLTLPHLKLYIARYAFVPASPRALTAVSSMFMHGGWMHIIGNMFFLIVFGRPVEHAIGSLKFGVSYMLAGLAALAVHTAITPVPALPLVGASGAISGVVGMFLVLFPRAPVDLHIYVLYWKVKTWQSTGLVATGVWFVEHFALGLLSSATGLAIGIAFWAHVGGFVSGVAVGFVAGRLAIGYP